MSAEKRRVKNMEPANKKDNRGKVWSFLFAESDSSHLLREEPRKTSGRSGTVSQKQV